MATVKFCLLIDIPDVVLRCCALSHSCKEFVTSLLKTCFIIIRFRAKTETFEWNEKLRLFVSLFKTFYSYINLQSYRIAGEIDRIAQRHCVQICMWKFAYRPFIFALHYSGLWIWILSTFVLTKMGLALPISTCLHPANAFPHLD